MAESAAPSVVTRVDADFRIGQPFTTSRNTIWQKSWPKTSAQALKSGCVSTLTMPEPTLQSWLHANAEDFAVA